MLTQEETSRRSKTNYWLAIPKISFDQITLIDTKNQQWLRHFNNEAIEGFLWIWQSNAHHTLSFRPARDKYGSGARHCCLLNGPRPRP